MLKLRQLASDWRFYGAILFLVVLGLLDLFTPLKSTAPDAGPLQHIGRDFWAYYQGALNPVFGTDFTTYYRTVSHALNGQSPYLPWDPLTGFFYPPFALTLLSIFHLPDRAAGNLLFNIFNILCYIGGIIFLLYTWQTSREDGEDKRFRWTAQATFILLAAMLFAPILSNVWFGQVDGFIFLCLALAFGAVEGRDPSPSLAGVTVALAALLKLSPIVLALYFLVTRRYRAVAFTVGALAVFSLVAWLQFGTQVYVDYLTVLGGMSAASATHIGGFNYSLAAILARLDQKPRVSGRINNIQRYISAALFAGASLAGYLSALNRPAARRWLHTLFIALIVFASPRVELHHGIFLMIPLIGLLMTGQTRTVLSGLAIILLIQAEPIFEIALTQSGLAYFGIPFLAAEAALIGVLVAALLAERRPAQQQQDQIAAGA